MHLLLKRMISDFHRQPLPKIVSRSLNIPLHIEKIITVIGPRRAGKTYYMFQMMRELEQQGVLRKQILYLNFEDERLDIKGEYDQIIEAYLELYPDLDISQCYLFFDEIQELTGWEKYIRRLYDTHTRHIVLSGSNARLLSKEIATALRGRSISYEIFPLSFMEYLHFQDIHTNDRFSTQNQIKINRAYESYLTWGGYPELALMDDHLKSKVLQEYFNVMIYRDLIERYDIRDASTLKYLIKRMILSFTKDFSAHRFYNELKSRGFSISKDMIYQMMEQIFSIYMMASIEKYDPSVVKREMSNKKIYLYDNGLASIANYLFFEDRGKLLENMVFSHLRRITTDVFFLRNTWECDFLIFHDKKPLLIQVTQTLDQDTFPREIKGLQYGKKRFLDAETFILCEEVSPDVHLPEGIHLMSVKEWLMR